MKKIRKFTDFPYTGKKGTKKYITPDSYRSQLKVDSDNRCSYCRLNFENFSTYPEIDHYIPYDEFKNDLPELNYDYQNLFLSCRLCNNKKKKHFKGSIHTKPLKNDYFYNPENNDYNSIFSRNQLGQIISSDTKGIDMINKLGWKRLFYSLTWNIERISYTLSLDKVNSAEREGLYDIKEILQALANQYIREGKNY